ncbi:MAG TPA: hypothetical protein VF741_00450 [Candidatus Aquilonibacter sp.]
MIIKRLAALMALGALLSTAAPALAVTQTGSVTVEWNYAITATLTMYTQTTASATHATTSPTDIYVYGAGAQCNGSAASSADPDGGVAADNGTVNYGNVVALGAAYSGCLETNAIDAHYVTNDSNGAKFNVEVSAGNPSDYDTATNGSLLCIEGDGFTASTSSSGGVTSWTASGNSSAPTVTATNACPANYESVTTAYQQFYSLTAAAVAGGDLNQDLLLEMGPSMQSGAQTVTVTYQMVTN